MSGGLDSSVAALLLQSQGYELTGVTFIPYESISQACLEKQTGCCNADTIFEAGKLAAKLGFEHKIIDVRDTFRETVVKNFTSEYMHGRTPNPCVLCNKLIKWGVLSLEAEKNGCSFIATGHYARIGNSGENYFLQKGTDLSKDQSYFLWMLTSENLCRTLFPLGNMTKNEVREIARKNGFTKIADRRESQEVCFIPDNNYRRFLAEELSSLPGEGDIRDINGKIIGKHKGFPFYTIGQRKGLQVATGQPVYVVSIDSNTNTIILGSKNHLLAKKTQLENAVFNTKLIIGKTYTVKIRYRTPGVKANLTIEDGKYIINFMEEAYAITPGQSAVVYDDIDVIGGGIIAKID